MLCLPAAKQPKMGQNMPKRKVFLSGHEFPSLTAARAHAKAILDKYSSGDFVNDGEIAFLKSAIALRGPEKLKEKEGVGIKSIFIDYNCGGDKAFYIRRIDGTETDFSYIKCFTKSNLFNDFSAACRNAIKDDKSVLKIGLGFDQYDAHHEGMPFKDIVQSFIEAEHIDITKIEFLKGDGVQGRYFKDEKLATAFKKFHSEHAVMEILEKEDHKEKHRHK